MYQQKIIYNECSRIEHDHLIIRTAIQLCLNRGRIVTSAGRKSRANGSAAGNSALGHHSRIPSEIPVRWNYSGARRKVGDQGDVAVERQRVACRRADRAPVGGPIDKAVAAVRRGTHRIGTASRKCTSADHRTAGTRRGAHRNRVLRGDRGEIGDQCDIGVGRERVARQCADHAPVLGPVDKFVAAVGSGRHGLRTARRKRAAPDHDAPGTRGGAHRNRV